MMSDPPATIDGPATPGASRSIPTRRIPLSQIVLRGPQIDDLLEPAMVPNSDRIRPFDTSWNGPDDRLISMGTMVRAADGGPLRLHRPVPGHENGVYPSWKAGTSLRWEGVGQLWRIIAAEVAHDVVGIWTESARFELPFAGRRSYTTDLELRMADGSTTFIEVKRDERDLEDPEYARMLSATKEVCRRCGMGFEVVIRDDIFESRIHRQNAEFFASRAFGTVSDAHLDRFEGHRRRSGGQTTYGELAEALEPGRPVIGKAVVQTLAVRRRVEIDLTRRLSDAVPVRMHLAPGNVK